MRKMRKHLSILLVIFLVSTLVAGCSQKTETGANIDVIDLDISELSGVLAYSQVVNINESPDDYMGKVIKLNGLYFSSYYDKTDTYYHYVLVGDEALCCQTGLEFVWKGEHAYPNDYPERQAEIELIGVFGSYEELGKTYYCLEVEDLSILE